MAATVAKREHTLEESVAQDHSVSSSKEKTNPFANVWLVFLATILIATLFCTAVLVAWPIVANLIAG